MVKSSELHSNTLLKWISSSFLVGLILISGLLSLRFANISLPQKEANTQQHVVKAFFAEHPGFAVLNEHKVPSWSQALSEIKSLNESWLTHTAFGFAELQFFPEGKSYLSKSLLIRPGLIIPDIIFPFHTYW